MVIRLSDYLLDPDGFLAQTSVIDRKVLIDREMGKDVAEGAPRAGRCRDGI